MRRPLTLSLLLACTCSPRAKRRCARKPLPPVRRCSTPSARCIAKSTRRVPAAQRYFDQGLRLAYGFNHEAAGRAFAEAARLDPKCAMCVWGQALVLGPNINLPMAPELAADATALASRAVQLSRQRPSGRPRADRSAGQALHDARACRSQAARRGLCQGDGRRHAAVPGRRRHRHAVRRVADGPVTVVLLDRRRPAPAVHERSVGALETRAAAQSRTTSARPTTTSTPSRPPGPRSAPSPMPTSWPRSRRVRATWCTCRRTSTSASAATTTPP